MYYPLQEILDHFSSVSLKVRGVYRFEVPSGSKGVQRSAPYPGFIFPFHGQARFSFDDEVFFTDVRKAIHGKADSLLGKQVVSAEPLLYISVLYEVVGNPPTKGTIADFCFEVEFGKSAKLKSLVHRLYQTMQQPGSLEMFRSETLLYCVLEELFTCAQARTDADSQVRFEEIASYLRSRFNETLGLQELAQMYAMSTNQLYYLFTKFVGMGPGDYLIEYRLNRAKELLLTTDLSIQEIAASTGYFDPLYFSRAFKKRYAKTPSAFRTESGIIHVDS
jgi:AraC-like DNA-binding protein